MQRIPAEVLASIDEKLRELSRIAKWKAFLTESRKNAIRQPEGEPLGYHLILGVKDIEDRVIEWHELHEHDHATYLFQAYLAGVEFVRQMDLTGWSVVIAANDGGSAWRPDFHVHVMVQPSNAQLKEIGLESARLVEPKLRPFSEKE